MLLPIDLFPYKEIVEQTKQLTAIRLELIAELDAIDKEGAQNAADTL